MKKKILFFSINIQNPNIFGLLSYITCERKYDNKTISTTTEKDHQLDKGHNIWSKDEEIYFLVVFLRDYNI